MNKAARCIVVPVMIFILISIGTLTVFADEEDDYDEGMLELHTIMRRMVDEFADHDEILKTQGAEYDGKSYRLTSNQKSEITELAESVVQDCTTDYEKIKAVCVYVADNLYYDYPAFRLGEKTYTNAYEAWKNKRTICDGYARLSEAMLDFIGIPCMFIIGDNGASSDGLHSFNAAYDSQENRWIYFDATWCSNNEYLGKDNYRQRASSLRYFDMSVNDISDLRAHSMLNVENHLDVVVDGVKYLLDFNWEGLKYSELVVIGVEDPESVELSIFNNLYGIPVGYIYNTAFEKCKKLERISLPDNVKWLDYCIFNQCRSLKTICYAGTVAKWHKELNPSVLSWNKYLDGVDIVCSDGAIDHDNTMTVKATNKTVKYKKLKSKSKTVSAIKVRTPIGLVRYKKIAGTSNLILNKKTGKITVRKKIKKGIYKIKVKVYAIGTNQYRPCSKTVLVKVKVK